MLRFVAKGGRTGELEGRIEKKKKRQEVEGDREGDREGERWWMRNSTRLVVVNTLLLLSSTHKLERKCEAQDDEVT